MAYRVLMRGGIYILFIVAVLARKGMVKYSTRKRQVARQRRTPQSSESKHPNDEDL